MPLFGHRNFLGEFLDPLPEVRFGAVVYLFFTEAIARFMELEFLLELGALGMETFEI
jgi:hypothetical protein